MMADQIEELFNQVDTSNDGLISLKELDKMFKQLDIKLKQKDVRNILNKFDKDNNKKISLEEFRLLITEVFAANKSYEAAYDAFKTFDKDGSNTITIEELKEACKMLPNKLSEKEMDDWIAKMDADGNGVIDFNEFAKAYACGL